MKLIIECTELTYSECKKISGLSETAFVIANGKPYDDSGDLISRKDLQAKHNESCAGECACCAYGVDYTKSSDSKFHCLLIDNAQAIPLPSEQIAWEQGYEAGLAQGKNDRPQGDCISRSVLDEIRQLYKKYQPNLATEVIEFGYALEKLIDNAQAVDLWQMRQEATENALKKAREEDKWGKWVITEVQCPECLGWFNTDCYSMEELNKCPSCGADMRGGAE